MTRKNLFKLGLASTGAALLTLVAGLGVWAAGQGTLTATDNVKFVADRFVDAKVSQGTNVTTFTSEEVGRTEVSKTATWANIEGEVGGTWWKDNTATTDSKIDAYALYTIKVENTSSVADNELTYVIANNFAQPASFAGTVTVDEASKTGELEKGESADVTFRFDIDGKYDLDAVATTWTVTLTAAKKSA